MKNEVEVHGLCRISFFSYWMEEIKKATKHLHREYYFPQVVTLALSLSLSLQKKKKTKFEQ